MATDLFGWVGAFLVLGAYALVALRGMVVGSIIPALMNMAGALCLCLAALLRGAWPFVTVNAAWFVIALFSLLKSEKVPAGLSDPDSPKRP